VYVVTLKVIHKQMLSGKSDQSRFQRVLEIEIQKNLRYATSVTRLEQSTRLIGEHVDSLLHSAIVLLSLFLSPCIADRKRGMRREALGIGQADGWSG
jgi:hypothetical protein